MASKYQRGLAKLKELGFIAAECQFSGGGDEGGVDEIILIRPGPGSPGPTPTGEFPGFHGFEDAGYVAHMFNDLFGDPFKVADRLRKEQNGALTEEQALDLAKSALVGN